MAKYYENKYCLNKVSSKGFSLFTDHEQVVFSVLYTFCCKDCRDEAGSNLDKLLGPSCGCEFYLEEGVDYMEFEKHER